MVVTFLCISIIVVVSSIVWKKRRTWPICRALGQSGMTKKMTGIDSKDFTDYFTLTGVSPPKPLPDFDINKALPRPYRPFRWKYHQTMCKWLYLATLHEALGETVLTVTFPLALQAMDPDWWLELECSYRERIAQRKGLYARHGRNIIDMMPGSENACIELVEMVIQFLCVRYPNQFNLDSSGIFHNRILGRDFDTKGVKRPLEFLLENVPEDFLIVQEDKETGIYHFCAGVSASAVGWNMSMKIGKPLHEVHGPVPYYKEKLQHSMDRFFVKMPCDKPIQRGSWSLEVGQPLYMQADDIHWAGRSVQDPNLDINDIYLRVDWQTLRRLPKSRAIVFNFKALFTPVIHFREEPFIPHLVATVLQEAERPFMEYKSTFHIAHKVVPALESWAQEQEEKGWVPKGWAIRTLEENPFYPGWQMHHRY